MSPAVTDGKRTEAFKSVKDELEPVGDAKVPKGFEKEVWHMLPYEDKLDFVRKKKEAVLFALQSRLTSPVVSLLCDLAELETRMEGISVNDGDNPLSRDYVKALQLKIELAKALKHLTDKGIVTHKHVVDRFNDGKEDIDINFKEILEAVEKDDGSFGVEEDDEGIQTE